MDRTDIFLSYRRADVEFTQKLYQQLKATDRAVWVDWENLPPGVEGFSDEIQRGIEGADAFVCVLSTDYLQSEYCLTELREALKLKKRVIPLVVKKFDPLPPPEGIGHINWIYFTPHAGQKNEFEDSFPKVVKALEADYEHAREHTRLLLRAMDWQRNDRNNSYLLKEAEIDKAERWQVAAVGKNPAPTELQGEYILASRAYQRQYQRRLTAIFGILTVFAVLAAIFAVIKRNEAVVSEQNAIAQRNIAQTEEARANAASTVAVAAKEEAEAAEATAVAAKQEADEQRDRAESERQNALISGLAAQSQLTQSRQLGILLALEAYEESEKKNEFNPAVETSLRSTLVDFTGLPVHSYRTGASFVQFIEDGDQRWLISASEAGKVQISDTAQDLKSEPITLIEAGLRNIVLSSDNQWLAGIVNETEGQEIRLWTLNDLQAEPETLTIPGEASFTITALSFSSTKGRQYWLAAGLDDGRVYRWNLQDLSNSEPVLFHQESSRSVTAMAFSPDGLWLAVAFSSSFGVDAGASPFLAIWSLQNLAGEPALIDLRDVTISYLEFSGSGKWLAGASDDGADLRLWNMAVGSTSPPAQALDVDGFNDIAFSPDENWVAVAQQSKVEVWALKKLFRDGIELHGYKDMVLAANFSHDSRTLATGDYDGQLHLWNTADFSGAPVEESQSRVYNSFDVIVRSLAFSADDSQLAAAGDEQVRVWNFPETISAPVRIADPQNYSIMDNALLVQPSDDRLYAMDLTGEEPATVLQTEQNGALSYFSSPDERYLAVIDNRQIEIWDLQNPATPIFKPGEQEGRVIAPLFTADSRWFVYAVYDQIFALDLQNPEAATELSGNRNGSPVSEFFTLDHWLFSKSTSEVLAWDTAAASLSTPVKVSTSPGVPSVHPLEEDSTWIFVQQSGILSAWNTAEPSTEALAFEGRLAELLHDRWLILDSADDGQQLWDLSEPDSALATLADYGLSESQNWLFYYDKEGVIQLLDLNSASPQPVGLESFPDMYPLFSPNDQRLAVTSQDGESVTLYDLTADMRMIDLSGSTPYFFSPDGHWLVTMSEEDDSFFLHGLIDDLPMMKLPSGDIPFFFSPDSRWLVTTTEEENSFDLYELTGDLSKTGGSDYLPIAFSPDDRWLILEGADGENALFDLEQRTLFPRRYPPNEGLEASPDGRWLYGVLKENNQTEALLIDLNDPEKFYRLTGHTDVLNSLTFTPYQRFLLTYGFDRTIRIWDLQNPAADPVVLQHEEAVDDVEFSANDQWLLSHTSQGIYIWPWDIEDVRELACRLVGRNLTQEEWTKYVGETEREQTCQEWP